MLKKNETKNKNKNKIQWIVQNKKGSKYEKQELKKEIHKLAQKKMFYRRSHSSESENKKVPLFSLAEEQKEATENGTGRKLAFQSKYSERFASKVLCTFVRVYYFFYFFFFIQKLFFYPCFVRKQISLFILLFFSNKPIFLYVWGC